MLRGRGKHSQQEEQVTSTSSAKRVSALGGILLAALLIATLTPKAVRPRAVAARVEVVGNVSVVNPTDANGNPVPVLTKDADSPIRSPFDIEESRAFALDPFNQWDLPQILTVPAEQVAPQ